VPERGQVGLVDRPPGQVAERGEHEPDGELADVAADEADRPEQRERDRDATEEQRPEPLRPEAEHAVGEGGAGARDDDQLVHGPAQALDDVEGGGEIRAALAEGCAHQDHRGNTSIRADGGGRAQEDAAEDRRDEDCEHRLLQREGGHEQGAGDDHQEADREVAPEQHRVAEPEHAQPFRNGLDSPLRRLGAHPTLPSPVRTGSGSTGVISARLGRAPR
jgi:hypothetical protein